MLAGIDSCFSLFGSQQHDIANKLAPVPTEDISKNESLMFVPTLICTWL